MAAQIEIQIPSDIARKLGYYVYAYVNPLDNRIFYVGKGKGRRVLHHLAERAESEKIAAIKRIRAAGKQPRIEILAHGLRDAKTALQVEAAVIDALGMAFLTNQVRGWAAPAGAAFRLKNSLRFTVVGQFKSKNRRF